jgi:hypothetical protein
MIRRCLTAKNRLPVLFVLVASAALLLADDYLFIENSLSIDWKDSPIELTVKSEAHVRISLRSQGQVTAVRFGCARRPPRGKGLQIVADLGWESNLDLRRGGAKSYYAFDGPEAHLLECINKRAKLIITGARFAAGKVWALTTDSSKPSE